VGWGWFFGDGEPVLGWCCFGACVGGEDDEGGAGWVAGDVVSVALVDSSWGEFVGGASCGECPDFSVGGEGVGVEVGEPGACVGVPGGEDCVVACADVGGGFAAYAALFLGSAFEFFIGDDSLRVLVDEFALPCPVVCHCYASQIFRLVW